MSQNNDHIIEYQYTVFLIIAAGMGGFLIRENNVTFCKLEYNKAAYIYIRYLDI